MKRLIKYAKPYYLFIVLAAAASIGCSAANVWVIDILKEIIDVSIQGEIKGILPFLLCKAAAVIAIGMISNYLVIAMTGFFGSGVLKDLRRDSVNHIMKIAPDFMEKNNFGDIMARLSSDISGIAGYMQSYFKDCLYVPIIVVVFAIYLFGIQPLLALICLFPLVILVPLSIKFMKPVKLSQFDYVKKLGMTGNHIQEAFDGADVIKAYNLQSEMENKYYDELKETFDISNVNDLRQYNIEPVSAMISEIPVALALCISGYLVFKGDMTIGMMVAFLSAVKKLIEPLDSAYQLVVRTQMAMVSVDRVFYVMDMPVEEIEGKRSEVDKSNENVFIFKDVSFTYGEKEEERNYAVENPNFRIKRGCKTAFVGKSGSGKSTILKLLCRQYEAGSGEILYYGSSFQDVSPGLLRGDLALISQDAVIFPMSIEDNIRIGNPDASKEEIIQAAKDARCHDFIMAMPDGYDSAVSERGNNLSGGQRQRIAIARAILKNADILLLDEPTSALDKETERLVNEAINNISQGKTVITVAHRLTTIMDYDEIIVMHEGKIVEQGTHEELIKQKGRYFKMFQEYTASGGGCSWEN